ncbi:MAG: efflux RND transporter periplasmic adaptor subunit, partial [Bacteroidetes bacterium]|nr:efflux RND transporter periplasmic adaptor subunit [Bacteroidota bacterium]
MKRLHQILLTITLYGILLTGCERAEKNQAASEADENRVTISDSSLQLMDVKIGEVESKIIQSYVYLNGKVVSLPNYRASVSSDIEGKVDQFFVKEGSYVKKGEPLIALRSMALVQLQSDYVEAKSQNDFLAIEFSRQEELMKNKVGALADFQVTEAKYKAARSKLSALAAKLRLLGVDPAAIESPNRAEMSSTLIIRAPIDGFVYKIFVVVGTLATTDIILAELVNTE